MSIRGLTNKRHCIPPRKKTENQKQFSSKPLIPQGNKGKWSKYLEDEMLLSPSESQVYCNNSGLVNTAVVYKTPNVFHQEKPRDRLSRIQISNLLKIGLPPYFQLHLSEAKFLRAQIRKTVQVSCFYLQSCSERGQQKMKWPNR